MKDHEFFEEIRSFFARSRTMSLATVDVDGRPHAANLQFVPDDALNLLYVSSPDSAHSRHVAAEPVVAATIYAHVDDPSQIHGVQLHGRCLRIDDEQEKAQALSLYLNRFTFIAGDAALQRRIRSETFYRLTPSWIRWIDNRRGFGFKRERFLSA